MVIASFISKRTLPIQLRRACSHQYRARPQAFLAHSALSLHSWLMLVAEHAVSLLACVCAMVALVELHAFVEIKKYGHSYQLQSLKPNCADGAKFARGQRL